MVVNQIGEIFITHTTVYGCVEKQTMHGNPNNSTVDHKKTRSPDLPCEDCGCVVFVQLRNSAACDNCGKEYY